MRVRTFFRNYMLIPVVLIPVFTLALFLLTWQGGLSMGVAKKMWPVLFALPVIISFVVIAIVMIVRLCRKLPVLLLVQVLVIELVVVIAFFILDYQRSTWMLNQYLYQDKREALVTRLKMNPDDGEEKTAMNFIDTSRNAFHSIRLHGDDVNLQNKHQTVGSDIEASSNINVMRDCEGKLLVEFIYDGKWLQGNYVVLYSEKKPTPEQRTFSDSYSITHTEYCEMIYGYKVLETISPDWYYAESTDPWNYLYGRGVFSADSTGCP